MLQASFEFCHNKRTKHLFYGKCGCCKTHATKKIIIQEDVFFHFHSLPVMLLLMASGAKKLRLATVFWLQCLSSSKCKITQSKTFSCWRKKKSLITFLQKNNYFLLQLTSDFDWKCTQSPNLSVKMLSAPWSEHQDVWSVGLRGRQGLQLTTEAFCM